MTRQIPSRPQLFLLMRPRYNFLNRQALNACGRTHACTPASAAAAAAHMSSHLCASIDSARHALSRTSQQVVHPQGRGVSLQAFTWV